MRDSIFEAFTSGSVPMVGNGKAFTSAAPDRRVLLVQGVTGFTKIHAQSADFTKRYAEYREANKPKPPAAQQSVDEAFGDQRRATEEQIKQLREVMQQLPPDERKEMQKDIEEMRASLEQQPGEWKLCFRAGKDATEAARAFATAWLKELGGGRG